MTNAQTVIEIMKLDQTGFGGLTKEGEAYLRKMMQAEVTTEQSPKEYAYLYTRLIPSMNKACTKVK